MGGGFNQNQRYEFHGIYINVQECAEVKHDNKWILPKWESKTTFPEWENFLLMVMEMEKILAGKYTPIQYLLRKQ